MLRFRLCEIANILVHQPVCSFSLAPLDRDLRFVIVVLENLDDLQALPRAFTSYNVRHYFLKCLSLGFVPSRRVISRGSEIIDLQYQVTCASDELELS